MLQYVTNAPKGPLYWPWSLAVTLNTAKEPESCTGHKLSLKPRLKKWGYTGFGLSVIP